LLKIDIPFFHRALQHFDRLGKLHLFPGGQIPQQMGGLVL